MVRFPPLSWLVAFGCVIAIGAVSAGDLLVDSFDDGFVSFSRDESLMLHKRQVGSMLGGDRAVGLSTERRPTTVTGTITQGSSALVFDTGSGASGINGNQGSVLLSYGGGEGGFPSHPLNLDLHEFDRFRFDITSLRGAGEIAVVTNSHVFGTVFTRMPLQVTGAFDYPFSFVTDWENRGFSDVDTIYFYFIGTTPDFAVCIGEIRIVPEPASLGYILAACALYGSRRFR